MTTEPCLQLTEQKLPWRDEAEHHLAQDRTALLRLLHEQMHATQHWQDKFKESEDARLQLTCQLDNAERQLRRAANLPLVRPTYCRSCTYRHDPLCQCPRYRVEEERKEPVTE